MTKHFLVYPSQGSNSMKFLFPWWGLGAMARPGNSSMGVDAAISGGPSAAAPLSGSHPTYFILGF